MAADFSAKNLASTERARVESTLIETSSATSAAIIARAPSPNDFRGLIFDLLFRSDLTEKTNLQLAALRKTQVSAFNLEGGNASLLTIGSSARLESSTTEALKLVAGLYYQRLGFSMAIVPGSTASGGVFVGNFAGERRTDHLYGFDLEAAYR